MTHESSVTDSVGDSGRRRVGRLLSIAIATGVIVRLTLRDSTPVTAPLFYALPLPVLAALALLRLGGALWLKQKRMSLGWAALGLGMLVWCGLATVRWCEPVEAPHPLRIVCWNVARGKGGWSPEIAAEINRHHPDLIGLIEAGGAIEELRDFWAQSFPEYDVVYFGRGLVCLTRQAAGQSRAIVLSAGGYAGEVAVRFGETELTVILVDLKSNPFRSRAQPLSDLARRADVLADRPVVILGDFNTPSDSVHFRPLRAHHREVFSTAGRGYAATWPVPFPVQHLDQIWTNGRVHPLQCAHHWTRLSDHRPVVADVAIDPLK